jgi:hypothetical protein
MEVFFKFSDQGGEEWFVSNDKIVTFALFSVKSYVCWYGVGGSHSGSG